MPYTFNGTELLTLTRGHLELGSSTGKEVSVSLPWTLFHPQDSLPFGMFSQLVCSSWLP